MSTITKEFTKEQLIEKLQHRVAVTANYPDVEEAQLDAAIFKIALASLEAEPVFEVEVSGNHWLNAGPVDDSDFSGMPDGVNQLYSAPPAPVSVPDELTREQYKRRFMEDDDFDDTFRGGWNSCRAAMLQGADGNSPVIPDGWVACSERMPSVGEQVLAYRPDAPESNDPLIKMATYVGGSAHGHGFDCYCKPTHWQPLPAAPQQEVK